MKVLSALYRSSQSPSTALGLKGRCSAYIELTLDYRKVTKQGSKHSFLPFGNLPLQTLGTMLQQLLRFVHHHLATQRRPRF